MSDRETPCRQQSADCPCGPPLHQDTRVVVAMSGGVDSSVTAGLLKAEGYDVVGVTLQLYDHGEATHRKGACCAGQDIHDARRVAERRSASRITCSTTRSASRGGDRPVRRSYIAGETPVPCVACNQTVKFHDLLDDRAGTRRRGARHRPLRHVRALPAAGRALYRPVEEERDQSYFLFATTRSSSTSCAFRSAA
jgi:tRNA-uridine 2-sulfurtransferase